MARSSQQPRQYLHSVDQIADMMRGRIRELVDKWELRGHVDGTDFVAFNPLRIDRHLGSFRISLSGPYQGLVKDFGGDGRSWTPLSFTADLWFQGNNVEAIKWAKGWLGLDGTDPDSLQKTRRAVEQRDNRDVDAERTAAKKRGDAHRMYLAAGAEILDTPVEAYLRGRGVDVRRFPFPLRALRFHPGLWNRESNVKWPAMLAPIVGMNGDFLGVHRTWLQAHNGGRVTKAPLDKAKMAFGAYRGGIIRLWNGIRVDPETGEIKPGQKLRDCKAGVWIDLTEGIEDGLSIAISMPELRVGAGVSVSNMGNLRFPDQVEGVRFWKQNDPPGSQADLDFQRVVDNQLDQGKRVRLAVPPAGVKDANDVLCMASSQQGQSESRGTYDV